MRNYPPEHPVFQPPDPEGEKITVPMVRRIYPPLIETPPDRHYLPPQGMAPGVIDIYMAFSNAWKERLSRLSKLEIHLRYWEHYLIDSQVKLTFDEQCLPKAVTGLLESWENLDVHN